MQSDPIKKSLITAIPLEKTSPKKASVIDDKITETTALIFDDKADKRTSELKVEINHPESNLEEIIDLVEDLSEKVFSKNAATQLHLEDLLKILSSKKFVIAELHDFGGATVLKNFHAADARKGHMLLLKGKAVLLHEGGATAVHPEAKRKSSSMLLDDASHADPEVKKLISKLKEKPLVISYLSDEAMQDFPTLFLLHTVTVEVIHAEPHAKTNSETIREAKPEISSKREFVKEKNLFAKITERLISIFMSWYSQRMEIEKEKIKKEREEEKENQIELNRKDKKRSLEKKEHHEAEDKSTLASKNEQQHVELKRSAAKINSKRVKSLKR